ncbi:MAG TPA: MarR family transcriptional regulator [Dehalococcoidia bacterium]|nr:MarR family transcriptional regulator [Dehalococcoidia bacterium]
MMSRTKNNIVKEILDLSEKIFATIPITVPPEWFSSDATIAQLRILLLLHMQDSTRMSSIASELGIALPTATGIVDNLVKKELVIRDADPGDRRVVVCRLSSTGQIFINKIWVSGQAQMERLLDGLSLEQLEKAAEVADILYQNASRRSSKTNKDNL